MVWYEHKYEYSFVQVLVLAALVALALPLQAGRHGLERQAAGGYSYGEVATGAAVRGHARLGAELQQRVGGELATLGSLAFIAFAFDWAGGFAWLARTFESDGMQLPQTREDWLLMVEAVYMQLFIGMLLYFFLVWCAAAGSVERLRLWERLRRDAGELPAPKGPRLLGLGAREGEREAYLLWRRHFLARLLRAQRARPGGQPSEEAWQRLREEVEQSTFSAHLAESLERGVEDFLVVHTWTWLLLLLLLLLLAVVQWLAHLALLDLAPCLLGSAALLLGTMWVIVKLQSRRLLRLCSCPESGAPLDSPEAVWPCGDATGSGSWAGSVGSSTNTFTRLLSTGSWRKHLSGNSRVELMLRFLQFILLVTSYAFAGILLSSQGWHEEPFIVGLDVALFALLFLLLALALPYQVPLFLAVNALPPFADEGSICASVARLVEQNSTCSAVEFGNCSNEAVLKLECSNDAVLKEGQDYCTSWQQPEKKTAGGFCAAALPPELAAAPVSPCAKDGRPAAEGPARLGGGCNPCHFCWDGQALPASWPSAATTCGGDGGEWMRQLEDWLSAVYTRCDPAERPHLQHVLAEHAGREAELVRSVVRRYEVSPPLWLTTLQPGAKQTSSEHGRKKASGGKLCVGCGRWFHPGSSADHRHFTPSLRATGRGVWL